MPSGIYKRTEETKRKIALSKIGNTNGFKKGEKKAPFTEEHKKKLSVTGFKKGGLPWNFGIETPDIQNEKHPNWKGDDVSYFGLHAWVGRYLGKPTTCEHCGRTGLKGRQIHWANKSHEYKRDLNDWLRLCVSCHMVYDENYPYLHAPYTKKYA